MRSCVRVILYDLKLILQLLATANAGQVKLPKLSREAERRPALVQVHQELEAQDAPEISQRHVSVEGFQHHVRVERKRRAVRHETSEGITIEMVSMSGVSGPVGIRVMRRHDPDMAARFGDAMELCNERHHVWNVFDYVARNDLVKFVVSEGVRDHSQIVNYIGVSPRI